jgi:hypothetical protein
MNGDEKRMQVLLTPAAALTAAVTAPLKSMGEHHGQSLLFGSM